MVRYCVVRELAALCDSSHPLMMCLVDPGKRDGMISARDGAHLLSVATDGRCRCLEVGENRKPPLYNGDAGASPAFSTLKHYRPCNPGRLWLGSAMRCGSKLTGNDPICNRIACHPARRDAERQFSRFDPGE